MFICLLILAVAPMGLAASSYAAEASSGYDAGDFFDDSDWGDGDWGDGGSFWDGDDWGGGDGGLFGGMFSFGGSVIVIFIVFVYVTSRKKRKGGADASKENRPVLPAAMPLSALKESDPNFSEQRILDMVGNLYVQMQNAWQEKDFSPMRTWLTDSLYNQMSRQLDIYIRNKRTNYIENICIMSSAITDYAKDGDTDVLTVRLTARIVDYTLDDESGELIRGSRNDRRLMTYDYKLIRKAGRITPNSKASAATSKKCPNCGAGMDLRYSGKCEYCSSVVTLTDYDWVLARIIGVSQRTIQ